MSKLTTSQKERTVSKIMAAIKDGKDSSRAIAESTGLHHVTVQKALLEMYEAGTLSRRKIGQTFIYSIKE